jgi:hypothetical protein
MQQPSPSDWLATFPTDQGGPLTPGTKRKRSPPVPPLVDSQFDMNGVINDTGEHADDRLRCDQCSITFFKEIKCLNRHRREICSGKSKLRCDYAGCSATFKAPRHKAAHLKNQHGQPITDELEQSGPVHREARPGPVAPASSESYESPYAVVAPQTPTTCPPAMPRLPSSTVADGRLSTLSAVYVHEQPSRRNRGDLSDPACNRWTRIEHLQAVLRSIWDRDIEILSKIIDHHEIRLEFGETAISELVRVLEHKCRESREPLADQWMLGLAPTLRRLTPVEMAMKDGFLEGVIYLLSRENRPKRVLQSTLISRKRDMLLFPYDAAVASFLSYHNRGTHPGFSALQASFSSGQLDNIRDELALCCPNPNDDMPGGMMKWLEHAIRRGNATGAYILLERGADRHAVLADRTTLVDLALENGQDEIAVLLLNPPGRPGCYYRHKILGGRYGGRESVLERLKCAAEAMSRQGDADHEWNVRLKELIDSILWIQDMERIRKEQNLPYEHKEYVEREEYVKHKLGFSISLFSHLL